MKRAHQRTILPSLLDRLIDREPANRREATSARSQTLLELKESVRRDLEWLLNSRRTPVEPVPNARELWRSVYAYGLPDVTGLAISSMEDHHKMARMIEASIANFEPRLVSTRVAVQPSEKGSRVLRFQIEALLRTDPAPARVYFDTTLELASGQYQVGGELDAR